MKLGRRVGYLCAGPRVSTHPQAEAAGPRTHVLGVIRAFETLGYRVERFLVGDRIPQHWSRRGSERALQGSLLRRLAADLARLCLGPWNAWRAWRALSGRVDWVYERYAAFQSLGWTFRRRGLPWILETNSPGFLEARHDRQSLVLGGLARRLELRAYRRCDALVCISRELEQVLVEEGVAPEKILVVPNGVDCALNDPSKVEAKRLFAGFTVGFVGHLFGWQGLDYLLDEIEVLRQQEVTIHLVVIGDGPCRERWERQTKQLQLTSQVAFLGALDAPEVPAYVAGFDLGFSGQVDRQVRNTMYCSPLKLYEYMALGVPVLATAYEDARRVLQEGETGFLFEPRNENDLRRALCEAYASRDELTEMGQRAREHVRAHHTWERRVSEMLAALEVRPS